MSNETNCTLSLHGNLQGSELNEFLDILDNVEEFALENDGNMLDALCAMRNKKGCLVLYFHDVDNGAMDDLLLEFLKKSNLTWAWSKGPDDEYGPILYYKKRGLRDIHIFTMDHNNAPCINLEDAINSGNIESYVHNIHQTWLDYQNNEEGFFMGKTAHEVFEDQAKFTR